MNQNSSATNQSGELLSAGSTCWTVTYTARTAMLVDASSYIPAMRAAIQNARESVLLIGWDFDPRVSLQPELDEFSHQQRFCDLISGLVAARPFVRIRILIWNMTWAFGIHRRNRPQGASRWLPGGVDYRLAVCGKTWKLGHCAYFLLGRTLMGSIVLCAIDRVAGRTSMLRRAWGCGSGCRGSD